MLPSDLLATAHAAILSRRSRHVPPPRDAPARRQRAHPAGEQAAVRALPDQVPAGVGDVQEGRGQLLDRGGGRPCGEPRPATTPPRHRPRHRAGHRLSGRSAAPRGGTSLRTGSRPTAARGASEPRARYAQPGACERGRVGPQRTSRRLLALPPLGLATRA